MIRLGARDAPIDMSETKYDDYVSLLKTKILLRDYCVIESNRLENKRLNLVAEQARLAVEKASLDGPDYVCNCCRHKSIEKRRADRAKLKAEAAKLKVDFEELDHDSEKLAEIELEMELLQPEIQEIKTLTMSREQIHKHRQTGPRSQNMFDKPEVSYQACVAWVMRPGDSCVRKEKLDYLAVSELVAYRFETITYQIGSKTYAVYVTEDGVERKLDVNKCATKILPAINWETGVLGNCVVLRLDENRKWCDMDGITVKQFHIGADEFAREEAGRILFNVFGPQFCDAEESDTECAVCLEPCSRVLKECKHPVCGICAQNILLYDADRDSRPSFKCPLCRRILASNESVLLDIW